MSDGIRVAAAVAQRTAENVRDSLFDICLQVVIAGSLRRGSPTVGDIEIVAHPEHAPELLARLDKWVAMDRVKKAVYPDGKHRWGEKYRGLSVDGLRVEIFVADADNFGYQFWLRTGPGEANHFVMGQLYAQRAPYRPDGGYWQRNGRKIRVPDEFELFRLLGADAPIPPTERTVQTYAALLSQRRWATDWVWVAEAEAPPVQGGLL